MNGLPAPTAAVCVPLRDEAARLPLLLDALAGQTTHDFVLCLLFDGCSDESEAIVLQCKANLPFAVRTKSVERGPPNAGRARRAAMAFGLGEIEPAGLIVSTDADSVPEPDWLAMNVAALANADIAAGRIIRERDRVSALQDRVEAYYDALFRLRRAIDPVAWEAPEPHHYTSGASLGFRADVYRDLGGFEAIPSAEDARLIDAAHRAGVRVRRDGAIRVATSSRLVGRAVNGLADHLRRLNDASTPLPTMAHPADAVWRYVGHAEARSAWEEIATRSQRLAVRLGLREDDVLRCAAEAPNAEAFAMRVVPDIPGGERTVSLNEAERALAEMQDARMVA